MSRLMRCGAVVLAALLAGCPSGQPGGTGSGSGAGSPAPDFTVKAVDLCKEYHADAKAADAKYKGKWLLVEGEVNDNGVRPGYAIGLSVELGQYRPDPNKSAVSVRADVASEWQKSAQALSDKQVVKIKGKCQGDAMGLYVDLVQCELVEAGPDPALPVTAEQLARDAADPPAAEKKYKGKMLSVEGTFVEVIKKGAAVPDVIVLQGHEEKAAKPVRVHASFPGLWQRYIEGWKKGQKVTLKANWVGPYEGKVSIDGARPMP